MSITLCEIMEQLQPKTGNLFVVFVLSILLLSFIPNALNKFYHDTGGDQLSAQHKRSTG